MGNNYYGQLGNGIPSNPTYTFDLPGQIVSSAVTAMACGGYHSLFVKSDGSLWAMRWNVRGQLGDGTFDTAITLEEIVSNGVVAVAAGGYHSLFLKSDGSLWATGDNYDGQLGDGTANNAVLPELVVTSNVVAIAGGYYHSLFIKSDGSLWAMGDNSYGQPGDGTLNSTNKPEEIVSNGVIAIAASVYSSVFPRSDGSVWIMGNLNPAPHQIIPSGVKEIASGWNHYLFLMADGSLWAMGYNGYGQLGNGSSSSSLPEELTDKVGDVWIQATCLFGGPFHLLAGTNLTQPLNQWTPVSTNSVTIRGTNNFSAILNKVVISGAGRQFYMLQSQ
jgi:alpha-tubulin suppressor-like RCC1 family protein